MNAIPHPITEEAALHLLASVPFNDRASAARGLARLTRRFPDPTCAACLPHLLQSLETAADPGRVLASFERFVENYPSQADLTGLLATQPRSVEVLAMIFSGSQYLTDILLRRPEQIHLLLVQSRLTLQKTPEQYTKEALAAISGASERSGRLNALRRWQRGELLRIGASDLVGQLDLKVLTSQLSKLAIGVVRTTLAILMAPHGVQPTVGGDALTGFAVIAMGKLGGHELNYSSDIDLLFVSSKDEVSFARLGQQMIEALAGISDEGFLYRVDMRLRPWGRTGALVPTMDAYLNYLMNSARLWEKQALLKARWIAGDAILGQEFLDRATGPIYDIDPEFVRQEVLEMKQRTETYLHQRGRDWGEVKLGEGSIRDIEFIVQYLQMAHGARQPELRTGRTLSALRRLHQYGQLPLDDRSTLTEGYLFLRTVEHHLQLMHYRQSQTLPSEPTPQHDLARRLGFDGPDPAGAFLAHYEQHRTAIRELYLKYIAGLPEKETSPEQPPEVRQHIERMDPTYEANFSAHDVRRHSALVSQLDESHLCFVDANPLEDDQHTWRVTVIAFDYPGELALICGLMFSYGLDILDGAAFTYEPLGSPASASQAGDSRRKIVDVFTVRPAKEKFPANTWTRYAGELEELLRLMQNRNPQDARLQLARRAAGALGDLQAGLAPLYPIEIEIDNNLSERYTVLRINSVNTVGFLYELTSALALNRLYIARVEIETSGQQVADVLYVTDDQGQKIISEEKQRELRAATVLIKHFTHLLPLSPDPQSALLHFGELVAGLFSRPGWPNELASLERPEVLRSLARLLGVSEFLWDDFLRMQYENLFPVVQDMDALRTAKDRGQLQSELSALLQSVHPGPQAPAEAPAWHAILNAFKDREMFRIDMRHILGLTSEFRDFSEELTDLAEVMVNTTYYLCHEDLRWLYGNPRLEDGPIAQMAVVALGKCGGRELGFASDIELMFIYEGNGRTEGREKISTAEFYEKLVENFLRAIHARREGIFEIDLQLRPYGKAGSLAVSLEAFKRYFAPDGPAWPYERQALVKLRAIAGSPETGSRIETLRDRIVYRGAPFDTTAMRAMRERQMRHLVKGGTLNPKYSPGSLVDIEYLVQGLQMANGHRYPELRATNTYDALAGLAAAGILSEQDYPRLRKAYTFFRWLIDGLRVVAGNARDLVVPAADSEGFAYLSRRMLYAGPERLKEDLEYYSSTVLELNRKYLGS